MKQHSLARLTRLTRRDFIRRASVLAGAAVAAPLLAGCSNATEATDDSPSIYDPFEEGSRSRASTNDITLSLDPEQLARTLKEQFERLKALAQNERQRARILFPTATSTEAVTMSIVTGGAALYRHVRIVRESSGEVANLLWGREGIHPSIKLADDAGRTLVKDGKSLEFNFGLVRREGRGSQSWLELGIKIAAIALAVWLGASILKPIIAAIAFVAFNAMVIGIVVAGVALLVGIVRFILDVTGWKLADVQAMFERTATQLQEFLRMVVALL